MRAHEFIVERKKKRKQPRGAAYGPGPYGGYGYYAGYSGDSGEGGDSGGGESIEHENFANSAEAYRAHLIKTLPQIMKLFANVGKGWIPSKDEMLSAVDNAYRVMKHTGDAKQAGKALMDELNTLHRMSQGQQDVDENFADGKKPGRKGLAKRSGVNTKASVSSLRKTAKNSTGEKARMAHWLANMKAGRAKNEDYANDKVNPGEPLSFPAGTSLVDVSDVYDWYKLGMVMSNLKDADPRMFNRGVPHTVIAMSSEEEEAKLRPLLTRLGFNLHDIDNPRDYKKAMLAKDVIKKAESIEEGWKDWVAGAAMGAASLSANANIARQLVEPGDTVYSIARQNNVNPKVVMQLNQFNRDTKLTPGQIVKVPDNAKEIPAVKKSEKKPETEPQQKANTSEPSKDTVANTVTGSPHEDYLKKVAIKAGITGAELVAFLSQCAHETMDFKHMKEIGGSLDFKKYDIKYAPKKAKRLGNDKVGDGEKYKGRGYIQLTGKDNYARAGQALGLPLAKHPELVEKPEIAAKTAIWYWKNHVATKVDDFKDTKDVTKSINPGLKHLDKRQEKQKAFQVAMR